MDMKSRLKTRLLGARGFTERLLQDLTQPADWVKQTCSQSNHAMWITGHLAVTDNFFLTLVAPDKAIKNQAFQDKFGMGSQPSPEVSDYPASDEVLAFLKNRRNQLLSVLEELTEEDFAKPTPDGSPDFLSDFGAVFETAVWHEGLHSGQLSIARRALGFQPLSDSRK
ncbi:MAG: DinB family protein [Pirellulales bacterium]